MQTLTVIDHIPDFIWMEILFPLDDGGKVGGSVNAGMIGFTNDNRRHGCLILRFGYLNDQGAVAFHQQIFFGQHIHQTWNIPVGIAFAIPQIESDAQLFIVAFHIRDRGAQNLFP